MGLVPYSDAALLERGAVPCRLGVADEICQKSAL